MDDATIFYCKKNIHYSYDWKETLLDGLKYSRVIVPIFNPTYFTSQWCMNEIETFRRRKNEHMNDNMKSIIFPILFFDGEHIPNEYKNFQYLDVRDNLNLENPLKGTVLAVQLELAVDQFAKDIANVIMGEDIPKWHDWEIVEDAKTIPLPSFRRPR